MSETQFSSLSPNSSNDLEIGNYNYEDNELFDQETLSITSDKSVANLEDFNDPHNFRIDPFLSDFMKDENEDGIMFQPWLENYTETNEMNVYFNSLSTENNLEDYLSVATDCLDDEAPDILDWDNNSSNNLLSAQKSMPSKRAFSPIYNLDYSEIPLPTKQRRVEVSSHIRCDEWINKYHEMPDKYSLKDSGMLDRRKTKHHKVLCEFDTELQVENMDSKRYKVSLVEQTSLSTFHNTTVELSYRKTSDPLSITSYSNKFAAIQTPNDNVIRKPFIHCNYNKSVTKSHITYRSRSDPHTIANSPNDLILRNKSTILSEVVEMSLIPAPLRMGKRISRRGHRLSLWQYLMCLLDCSKYRDYTTGIKWINRNNGVFHIVDSKQVATLWGRYKERREKMTYDSLARSLRHYYKKNLMAKINNRRLVYQIAQECIQWSTESFVKKSPE